MREFDTAEHFAAAVGVELGQSGWFEVSQQLVDRFGCITGDLQWIHVDRARAADGPFGTPVAHGFLLLALVPRLLAEIMIINNTEFVLNSGLRNVSFDAAVEIGSFVKLSAGLNAATQRKRTTTAELNLSMSVGTQGEYSTHNRVALRASQTLVIRSERDLTTE